MIDLILENSVITQQMISLMATEKQQRLLVELLSKPIRPQFAPYTLDSVIQFQNSAATRKKQDDATKVNVLSTERNLCFIDIVESLLNAGHKSSEIMQIVSLMQNEIEKLAHSSGAPAGDSKDKKADNNPQLKALKEELSYEDLFALFVLRRKVTLLRYLFMNVSPDLFKFSPPLFLKALELDAYDMAALLFKEFFRIIRDVSG
jgi:hypothetical protein